MSIYMLKRMPYLGRVGTPWALTIGHKCFASRTDCAKDDSPRCSPEKMAKAVCENKTESMWFNPKCCLDPCKDALPRFDELYYKPSNKYRKYARTWVECPKLKIMPKRVCCYESSDLPPIERRERKPRDLAQECSPDKQLLPCHTKSDKNCVKIRLAGCRAARDPPRCFELRPPKDCKKVCAPFPSYSECHHPKAPPQHPKECRCLYIGPFCRIA